MGPGGADEQLQDARSQPLGPTPAGGVFTKQRGCGLGGNDQTTSLQAITELGRENGH